MLALLRCYVVTEDLEYHIGLISKGKAGHLFLEGLTLADGSDRLSLNVRNYLSMLRTSPEKR